ncbi:uncharacterized protein LOC134197960 [Corticium candelabrum]|uniref:uncharacterized protein LOC134197960 n=1 Tax=Corticium candelabrum TaxID=121492 RepID=UPI002E2655E9|nr:uncharacterized protein LOC134197960 [Corticium candelabrum]
MAKVYVSICILWKALIQRRRALQVERERRRLKRATAYKRRRREFERQLRTRRRMLIATLMITCTTVHPRAQWCKPRSRHWWQTVRNGSLGEEWWRQNFRMKQETFGFLCEQLRPYVQKQRTRLREPISVEERVAVTIWKLATCVEYRTLSALFGLGRSTVGSIVLETCYAIAKYLLPQYVSIPQEEKLKETVNGFEGCWGFPQAAGAIDGTHIPIIRPDNSASDYYNRKGYYSIIMQGLVDFRGHFLDVNIGWPGKVHDARVFLNSNLYQKATAGTLFPAWTRNMFGVQVPLVILGDPAYPSLPWLIKPFRENEHTSKEQKHFNYCQSRARMVVENTFGRLKGRWRCLLKRLDLKLENVGNVVAACVVLHNLCEMFGDHCSEEWTIQEDASAACGQSGVSAASRDSDRIRCAIMSHLTQE